MKKTLMVLTFALCATFVFAQTANLHAPKMSKAQTSAVQAQNTLSKGLFTKEGTTLLAVDFHDGTASGNFITGTGYTTGTVTSGSTRHGESAAYSFWRRLNSVDSTYIASQAEIYPTLAQNYFGGIDYFATYLAGYVDSAVSSSENGFMMMSVYDQRTPQSGNFNAYIQFNSVDASAATVVDVEFFQYYRKYYDYCYIDYTTDGSTWNATEINVRGIDVGVNGSLNGIYAYTLPLAAAGSSNLGVRIRYYSPDSDRGGYGYFWCIDDVAIQSAPADRLKPYGQEYVDGNYSLVPEGMALNTAWYSHVINNGSNTQQNIIIELNHLNSAMDNATPIASYNNGSIGGTVSGDLICDPHGLLNADSLDYRGWFGYADPTHPHGTGNGTLPSSTTGDNYVYAGISTDAGFEYNYDTLYYNVNAADANGDYLWGHDNGILVYQRNNYYIFGFIQDGGRWYVSEDPEEVNFDKTGYSISTRYTTGSEIPNNWVIRGVELVACPLDGYHAVGSMISATLVKDSFEGGSVYFKNILTGAGIHEVAANEVNDSSIVGRGYGKGYKTLGNYNTVRIMFPEQPRLEPNTSYRIGYAIEEESPFAIAAQAMGSYREASPTRPDEYDTIIYFRNVPSLAKYARTHVVNQYEVFFNDNTRASDPDGFASYNSDKVPMIRMIVGPEHAAIRHNIGVQCEGEDFGATMYNSSNVCGTTITPVEGTSPVLYFYPNEGCKLESLTIDGQVVEVYNEIDETGDINFRQDSNVYIYQFVDLSADHQVQAVFGEGVGIDPIAANVRMNLQPNPANAQVTLSVAGATGMLNCAIIDMSGRVVYNTNFNAENSQVINLSNLAKGAYFVRITNNNFSKVEKLIVR